MILFFPLLYIYLVLNFKWKFKCKFILFTLIQKYMNTMIVVCYIEYYRRRVDSGQKSRAFELTTTTVQLLMGGSFICKTNYKAHTIDNH